MKKNLLTTFLACLFLIGFCSAGMSQNFAGGSGTENDPYEVASAEDLNNIRDYLDAYFVQTSDISLEDFSENEGWSPIGDHEDNPFTGNYDGNGYEITRLVIDRPDTNVVGLFGYTSEDAGIKNVSLDVNMTGNVFVGGLVGFNRATITDCYVEGTVEGFRHTGGMVGRFETVEKNNEENNNNHTPAEIVNCETTTTVSGSYVTGGMIGSNRNGLVTTCYSSGNISGEGTHVGGLVGYNWGGYLTDCHASGKVTGEESLVGGLVGHSRIGTISNSFAEGEVSGVDIVGGLVGQNITDGTIEDSYATGNVSGEEEIGGLVGLNRVGLINRCFARGEVNATDSYGGGLTGTNWDGTVKKSFASGNVTVEGTSAGGLSGLNRLSVIENCYATGQVRGEEEVGGLLGSNTMEGVVKTSFAIGIVSGEDDTGGLVGKNDEHSEVEHSYYDSETTLQTDEDKGMPTSTEDMMLAATFQDWNFEEVWAIEEGESYPFLQWEE